MFIDALNLNAPDWTNAAVYWQTLVFCTIAYLIGSVNFGKILSGIKRKNLAEIGSKSFGATNAGRAFGPMGFLFVFCGDFFKPILTFIILSSLTGFSMNGYQGIMPHGSITFALTFCLIGHMWPIYWKFRMGGKGVATWIGITAIINIYVCLLGLVAFTVALLIWRRVSISSILLAFTMAILFTLSSLLNPVSFNWYYESIPAQTTLNYGLLFLAWTSFVLITYKHKTNIIRVIAGTESYVSGIAEFRSACSGMITKYFK